MEDTDHDYRGIGTWRDVATYNNRGKTGWIIKAKQEIEFSLSYTSI